MAHQTILYGFKKKFFDPYRIGDFINPNSFSLSTAKLI